MSAADLPWRIDPGVVETVRSTAVRRLPEEACGLLLGLREPRRVLAVHELPNVHEGPRERNYRLDALAAARVEAALPPPQRVLGAFHSHVDGTAEPSASDAAAALEGWLYLLQSVTGRGKAGELRLWRWDGRRFQPMPIVLDVC